MTTERRKALVTGSGRNIGRAIALRLARAGCDVVINVRSNMAEGEAAADAARALGVNAIVCAGDVGTPEGVDKIADKTLTEFGNIDILVNVAGLRPFRNFLDMTYDEWREVIDANLGGVFLMTKAFVPGMVERKWGRLINFAGMNSIRGYPQRTHIAASKHGVWGLTKALSREFGPDNITANCISPGPTETEQHDPKFAQAIRDQVVEIPLGRLGKPEEIAGVVAFLTSEEGGFVSGQIIGANGAAETSM